MVVPGKFFLAQFSNIKRISYRDQSYATFVFRSDRQSEIEFEQIELETENRKFPFKKN